MTACLNKVLKRVKTELAYQRKSAFRHRSLYLFMLPFALVFTVFTILPVITSIFLGFTYFNILEAPEFIGITNYFKLFFNDDIFIKAVGNTMMFAVITGPLSYFASLLLAWVINDLPRYARTAMTLFFYAPSISGGMYMIWTIIFSGDAYGYMNGFLMRNGFISVPIQWLKDETYMNAVIIVAILWMSFGTGFLSFIAGFQGIDKQYFEAGAIDGIRNRWQEFWFITLPMMKPQLRLGAVMSITASFGIGDVITGLVGFPSVNYHAHTIMNHLTDYGTIRFEMGYASAIATILFAIMILSNLIVKKLLNKVGS